MSDTTSVASVTTLEENRECRAGAVPELDTFVIMVFIMSSLSRRHDNELGATFNIVNFDGAFHTPLNDHF